MGKPQDLPGGESQMIIGITLNFVTYVIAMLAIYGAGNAVVHAAVDIGLTGAFLYVALRVTSMLPRFHQAYGALCGAGAVLNVAAILMLYPAMSSTDGAGSSVGAFAYYLLLVWSLSLTAHVLRHTFGIRMVTSIGIALLYYLFVSSLLVALFPPDSVAGSSVSWQLNHVQIADVLV